MKGSPVRIRASALKASADTARAVLQENVEIVRRMYAALNDAYKSGNVHDFLPLAEET